MSDSMEAFWGSLGVLADPTDAACGCSLGAASGTIDASDAASRVVSQYVALSAQGEKLRQQMAAGVKIPCEIWAAYAAARQDYLTKSQPLFDQLAAKGVTIEQVVYSGGKPVPDPADLSKCKTLIIQAPLRPPAFVGINEQCPSVSVMYGASLQSSIGWEPTPIALGSVASSVVSALGTADGTILLLIAANGTLLGSAGYGVFRTIKQVAVALQSYDASPSNLLTAYTGCFDSAVKAGMSAADATKQCQGVQSNTAALRRGGVSLWTWIGLGAVAFILGGLMIRAFRKRGVPAIPVSGPILMGDLYFHPRRSVLHGR